MVFFSEDKPRTCCCGCTMTMGVIFFTILSALQGVQLMNQGLMDQSVPSFIFAGTGIAALMSDSYAVRQLNNCVWSLFAGVTVFVMLFIILVMAKTFSENGVLLHRDLRGRLRLHVFLLRAREGQDLVVLVLLVCGALS